jgi:hypothetical protein
MKAQELRIGNLLKDIDGNIVEVITVYGNGNYVVHSSIHQFAIIEKDDDLIIPIQITEEWLLRFGFKKTYFNEGNIKLPYFEKGCLTIDGCLFDVELFDGTKLEIKCVHQLQNLYFALNGEELIHDEWVVTKDNHPSIVDILKG